MIGLGQGGTERILASGIRYVFLIVFVVIFASRAYAGDIQTLDVVEVTDSTENPIGIERFGN